MRRFLTSLPQEVARTMPSETYARMVDLARDLQSADSAEQTLQHVVDASVELIEGCEHAGISLASRQGRIRTSVATSGLPQRSDELQQELGEGPCVDAVWRERVVSVPDLPDASRWPRWAPKAVEELDVGSMVCLQLFTHEDRVGALNLFSSRLRAFTEADIEEGLAIAAHAAVAVVAAEKIEGLQTAMHTRSDIGQAMGLLMARYQLSSQNAFNLLRRFSNEQNRKISTLARELIDHHEDEVAEQAERS